MLQLDEYLPKDARGCMRTLDTYGYNDILHFLREYRFLKKGIVGSLEMYSRFPAGTDPDIVFRTVMNSLDRVLSILDPSIGELFPRYLDPITDDHIIRDRVLNIDERLIRVYGKLESCHQIDGEYSLACRVEKYTRYKDIDKTLYRSPGALQVVRDATSSLASMGIN